MTSIWKGYGRVAVLMVSIVLLSVWVTALTGADKVSHREKMVVTTNYPLYVAVRNIIGDSDTVTVENLTGAASGCLHDYQLTPANRITLDAASLVLLNGGGAENFLADTLAAMPELPTVDTSADVALLESCVDHDHSHGTEGEEHTHTVNEHLWVSPTRYAAQVNAVAEALCALDAASAATYRANAQAYSQQVLAVGARLRAAADKLSSKRCVIFHDSLAYLADELGLTVVASLHVGEESGVSAAALAQAQQVVAQDPQMLLLYDSQYSVRYPSVDATVSAGHVLTVNTAVSGRGGTDDWLVAMEHNAEILENVTEGEL